MNPQHPAPPPFDPVAHEVVSTWPPGTFVENLAVLPDGLLALSVHNRREILFLHADGSQHGVARLPLPPAGLVAVPGGVLAVAGEPGQGPHRLLHVALDGAVQERMAIPDTLFLNGFTPGQGMRAYAVDSIVGMIVEIDLGASTSRVLLRDERLGKLSADPMLPGANGIKCGDSALFVTNTDRELLLRIGLAADGAAGALSVVAGQVHGDDFALDEAGDFHIATHTQNALLRLRANGERSVIAGPAQGMAGATACAFHPDGGLFVTTTGGIIAPLDGVVQPAKLVRLDVAARGWPVGFGV